MALGVHECEKAVKASQPRTRRHPEPGTLAGRYARQRGRGLNLLLVLAGAVTAAVAVGWLIWVMVYYARPQVQSGLIAFEITSKHSAEATFTVRRSDPDVTASCLLRAYAPDHSIVGELNFEIDSSALLEVTMTKQLRTERKATSVTMIGCRADGQTRRR